MFNEMKKVEMEIIDILPRILLLSFLLILLIYFSLTMCKSDQVSDISVAICRREFW